MIKSPLTSPLRPALTSPYELITRSVFEFNGTQWGELSESVVLDGDFEIEVTALINTTSAPVKLMDGDIEANRLDWHYNPSLESFDDRPYFTDHMIDGESGYAFIPDNKVHTFAVKRDNTAANQDQVRIGVIASRVTLNQAFLLGCIFSIKVWVNGDRNTGDIILDIPFNEQYTDYQCNRAFVGDSMDVNRDWYYQGGLISSDGLISIDFPAGDSGPAATAQGGVFDPAKSYIIDYEILSLSSGSGVRLNHGSNGVQDEPYNFTAGIKTAFVIANGSGNGLVQFYATSETQASIRILSIREWSGAVLHNALPEDWMQIERKRYWDYWLGVENVFSADVVAGFWQALPGNVYTIDGTQTSNNDITTDSAMTVGGTFIFTGLGENIVGTFAFRAGPNEILIIESAGFFEAELTAEIVDIVLRAQPGASGTFSKLSVRRKLEIAQ